MKKFTKVLALTLVVIMSVLTLVACATPAKDPEKAEKALKDNDYDVRLIDDEKALEAYAEMAKVGKLTAALVASNEDDEYISILWFENSKDAKEAYEDAKKELEEMIEEDEDYKEYVVGKSGKMVWQASSKDAVKAAK